MNKDTSRAVSSAPALEDLLLFAGALLDHVREHWLVPDPDSPREHWPYGHTLPHVGWLPLPKAGWPTPGSYSVLRQHVQNILQAHFAATHSTSLGVDLARGHTGADVWAAVGRIEAVCDRLCRDFAFSTVRAADGLPSVVVDGEMPTHPGVDHYRGDDGVVRDLEEAAARLRDALMPRRNPGKAACRKRGRPPLDETKPDVVALYRQILDAYQPGQEHRDLIDSLKRDPRFTQLAEQADRAINTSLIRAALSYRGRLQSRNSRPRRP
jgi:hypothetical protein